MSRSLCLGASLVSLLSVAEGLNDGSAQVSVASLEVLFETEPTYASWNFDSSCNRGFHYINFTNPNLLAAARGLRPSKLRFGGSGNDNLVYGLSPGSPECAAVAPTDCGYTTPGCLNATHWDNLHDFAKASESEFVFGVAWGLDQACSEGAAYVWNSSNAATLLNYIRDNGQSVWGFEFGNEVNNNGGAPCNQTAEQQAAGQRVFAQMVRETLPESVLIGPDTGYKGWQDWLSAYLPLVEDQGLHAITHHVYGDIRRSTFNNASTFDSRNSEVQWYASTLRKLAPKSQIWAGEDGPKAGGNDGTCGADSACGTYGTTLWYADDLAVRAKNGFVQYQRQDLFGGYYGLTNSPSASRALSVDDPLVLRPDYWINFLWKRTLGTQVLDATSTNDQIRAYAFSGKPPSPFAAPECAAAALQLVLINLDTAEAPNVQLGVAAPLATSYVAWTLAPSDDGPFAETALLNDVLLPTTVDVAAADPEFLEHIPQPAKQQAVSSGISLPPVSTSFLCLFADSSQESSHIVV